MYSKKKEKRKLERLPPFQRKEGLTVLKEEEPFAQEVRLSGKGIWELMSQ